MLTQNQIDAFHRDGLLVIAQLVDAEHVTALRRAVDATTAKGLAGDGPGHAYHDVDGEARYFRTDGVWEYEPAFRTATVQPPILAVVGQLLGRPFMPINDSIVVKLPRSGVPVPWHQDPPYQGAGGRTTTFGVPNFDVDIYLDDTTVDNGCLYAIAAHHLFGHVELERFSEDELFGRPDARPIEMAPGDVLVHCSSAPHGSRANASDDLRRVVYFHYMAREVLESLLWDWAVAKQVQSPYGLRPTEAFDAAGLAWAQACLEEAGTAEAIGAYDVSFGADGFQFDGEPRTARHHWRDLVERTTADELARGRSLDGPCALVSGIATPST